MTTPADPSHPAAPSVREIAALTARLREITAQGRDVAPAERAQFLADKDALIAGITATETDRSRAATRERYEAQDALADAVRVNAEHPGYVMVGPSARTWLRDPVTGQPAAPVSEPEHRAVRELLQREELDTTEPAWVTSSDGQSDVHSVVYPTPYTAEDDATEHDDAEHNADPAWWAPTGPDEMPLSHHEVAAELTERGFTPEQARAAVTEYLDDTSDRIGTSVHQWAMDSHDVEAIAHTHRPPVPVPEQRHPSTAEQAAVADPTPARGDAPPDYAGERDAWEQVRGDDPRSYEQMIGDAAGALTTHRPDRPTDTEGDRREQLARWHTYDTTGGPGHGDDIDNIGSEFDDEAVIFEGRRW